MCPRGLVARDKTGALRTRVHSVRNQLDLERERESEKEREGGTGRGGEREREREREGDERCV